MAKIKCKDFVHINCRMYDGRKTYVDLERMIQITEGHT